MKAKLRLKMCQACGQYSNNCTEFNGEILCPECKTFEEMHIEERIREEQEMSYVFDGCSNETY